MNTTQAQLANTQRQLEATRAQLAQLEQAGATKQADVAAARTERQAELHARQQADQPTRRVPAATTRAVGSSSRDPDPASGTAHR